MKTCVGLLFFSPHRNDPEIDKKNQTVNQFPSLVAYFNVHMTVAVCHRHAFTIYCQIQITLCSLLMSSESAHELRICSIPEKRKSVKNRCQIMTKAKKCRRKTAKHLIKNSSWLVLRWGLPLSAASPVWHLLISPWLPWLPLTTCPTQSPWKQTVHFHGDTPSILCSSPLRLSLTPALCACVC